MNTKRYCRIAPLLASSAFVLLACGGNGTSELDAPTAPETTTETTVADPTVEVSTSTALPTPTPAIDDSHEATPAAGPTNAAPVITGCQTGLGPIVTYWSDGSVTGHSDYCQSVHDEVSRREVEANTPVCDGTVCRFPNGAEMPDPSASNQLPEPAPAVPHVPDYSGGPSSGEIQMRYACEEGYADPAECDRLGMTYGG